MGSNEDRDESYILNVRGGKNNDIREVLPGFETPKEVKERSEDRQYILFKSSNKECQKLAQRLGTCSEKWPCFSPACPVCARQYRRWFYAEVNNI